MIGHSVLRFQYNRLGIVIKVNNKPLHGRRVLSDHADSPLKESRYLTVKSCHLSLKIDNSLLSHCGYFSVGRLDAGVPTPEGIHYII